MHASASLILAALSFASAAVLDVQVDVHLAVNPKCGTLSGNVADVNAGLAPLSAYKTVVSFGDAYSDGGVRDGSPLKPSVLSPPNPRAGGRASNGPIWNEVLATGIGATFKDYAADGAVVDASQYTAGGPSSLIDQVNFFTGQGNRLDRNTTLYTTFFGIGDFERQGNMDLVAQNIEYQLLVLTSSPTFARNILVVDNYGRGAKTPEGEAYKQHVFTALRAVRSLGVNVGYVDLSNIWNGVLGSTPGYKAFGYTNPGACLKNSETTAGACADPAHSFYWLPGVPSAATHRIVADYVKAVFAQCKTA